MPATVTRLPVGFERLSMTEVRELLAGQFVVSRPDLVAHLQGDAVQQLVNGVVPVVELHDEHAVAGVDSDDGASLHSAASDGAAIVAQGGAA